jgi:AcrR family transcriptional regulator
VASAPGRRTNGPRLDRERITAAALAVIDAEGLDAATMRRLAAELGVQAPSLYNHVASKDAILDAVAESVIGEVDASGFETLPWRQALDAWAWSYYEALVAHPNVVPHLARAFGRIDASLERAERVYEGLLAAGWSASRATRIAAAVRYAVYGAALGSFAGSFVGDPADYVRRYPGLHDVGRLREQGARVDRAALRMLIDRFLDGLDAMAPAAGG